MNLVQRPYAFTVSATSASHGIQTRFVLSAEDGGQRRASSPATAEAAERERLHANLLAQLETLKLRTDEMRKRVAVGTASALDLRSLEDSHGQLERELAALGAESLFSGNLSARSIIDSSFTMDAGETVVVGTSRLGGDKALIALVTAVRRPSEKRR